jgi:hypothetical protein
MKPPGWSRREWLGALLAGAAVARARAAPDAVRLLVHGRLAGAAMQGLQFGVAESAVTAGLMQRELQLGTSASGITGAIGVIAAEPPGADAVPARTPVVLLGDVPGASPGSCLFRVGLAPAERQAALSRWRSTASEAARAVDPRVVEWHPALDRFGAKDLNDRYRKQTGGGMTAEAWAAWFAVKALVDSALRGGDADRCRALAQARFDGHKGRALRFDPETRVLRQPLYVVSGDKIVGEIE